MVRGLPNNSEALLDWLLVQPVDIVMRLMAYCMSRSIDTTFESSTAWYKKIGELVNLDVRTFWKPNAESYFKRVSKEHMVEVVNNAGGMLDVDLVKIKKGELATKAAEAIKDSNWLPELLVV